MDLNAVKAKLQALNKKTSKTTNLWKPEEGKQTIRILPYKFQPEMPFMELYFHYGIGKRSLLSPVTTGGTDPIVEFAQQLKSTGDREDFMNSLKLTPKMRTYVPVLVRGKEKEGVKFWGFGKIVYQELLGYAEDPDYANFEDPMNGRDFTVDFTKGAIATDNKTVIRPKPNTSPISEDKEIIKLVGDQPNLLEDVFEMQSYEDLKTALYTYLNPEEEEDKHLASMGGSSTETTTPTTPVAESKPEANTKDVDKVEDVGAAFDNLFNN